MGNIRPAREADAAAIADIYNYYISRTIVTFEEVPVNAGVIAGRMAELKDEYPWLVYEKAGAVLGYIYAGRYKSRCSYRHSAEISIYLQAGEAGHGIGTRLFERFFAMLEGNPVHALIGCIALPNDASVRLHEKFGFEKVAHLKEVGFKFNQWIDVGYWEKIIRPGDSMRPCGRQSRPAE